MYRASAGTVYPILQELEDESLIVSELREGKKVYGLTEQGKRGTCRKGRGRPAPTATHTAMEKLAQHPCRR
jgi:DNA-binding PadR family transcriptional regulator